MKDKIEVVICAGTLCHVVGGAELFTLSERLDPALSAAVEIKGCPCLDRCKSRGMENAPFVTVGGALIERATVENVIEAIRDKYKEYGGAR